MDSMTTLGKKWRLWCIILSAILLAAVIVLAVFLGIYASKNGKNETSMENSYRQSYYVMMDNLFETEFSLKKLSASATPSLQEKFLTDAAQSSAAAVTAFNQLAVENATTSNIMKTLNQISEYANVMARQISDGKTLTDPEKGDLGTMLENIGKINVAFGGLNDKIADGYKFTDPKNTVWSDILTELDATAAEFPIYTFDGNSCLLIGDQEPKGLSGEAVTAEQAQAALVGHFAARNITDVKLVSQNDRKLAVYYFEFKLGGVDASAEITKKGGHILNYTVQRDITDPVRTEEEAAQIAADYLAGFGFEGLKLYMSGNSDSYIYLDYVSVKDGIYMIADKVRLKIAADNGEILGFSANCYYNFHYDRGEQTPVVTEELVREKVSPDIEIAQDGVNLVMYPIGNTEKLAYEIKGTFDGDEYYVYVDATSGNEIDVLRVIDSDGEKVLK